MKHYIRRPLAVLAASVLLVQMIGIGPVLADEPQAEQTAPLTDETVYVDTTYTEYSAKHQDAPRPAHTVTVSAGEFVAEPLLGAAPYFNENGSEFGVKTGMDKVKLTYTVDVPETGLYNLQLRYYLPSEVTATLLVDLQIDGERPFAEAGSINFYRVFKDAAIEQNQFGNDVEPEALQVPQWISEFAYDTYGGSGEYAFYFTAGTHELSFVTDGVPFLLESFTLCQTKEAITYEEYLQACEALGAKDADDFTDNYQAELLHEKSDSSILISSDRSSSLLEPFDYRYTRLNILSGSQWTVPGQWVSWEITVPETGYYTIYTKFRQSYLDGLFSSRRVLIDGEVPFAELEAVRFNYCTKWEVQALGGDTPFRFYLTQGKHILTMQNVTGDLSETISTLQQTIQNLNELYLSIMMITGSDPDPNRDYYLSKSIPDIADRFFENADAIEAEMKHLTEELGMKGSETAAYENIAYSLRSYGENITSLTSEGRLGNFQGDIITLSSKLSTLQGQGLDLDFITVSSPEKDAPRTKQTFWEWLSYTWNTFITSFTYRAAEESESQESELEVWINGGSDQLQIAEKIIDSSFTSQYGIKVDVKLAPGTLLQATASGLAPDVALNIPSSTPVNFALRGALANLSQFEGFEELKKQYIKDSFVPYTQNDVVFAVPATQSFQMMFVRDDIFKELGIEVPKTWENLLDIAPIIQRKNMQIGIGTVFSDLVYQNGGQYYTDDLRAVAWDTQVAVDAFKLATSFYTDYSFPLAYDATTRFRTGEMPLFIGGYTTYSSLSYSAPEINGLWSMYPLPGVEQEDGSINHGATVNGETASIIFQSSQNKENAWKFLRWWADAKTQAEYGNKLEARLGVSARYATANREAFQQLAWTKSEETLLMQQMDALTVLPILPGYYYVTRGYTNSFNATVIQQENPREVLLKWTKLVNEELERKQKEFDKNN